MNRHARPIPAERLARWARRTFDTHPTGVAVAVLAAMALAVLVLVVVAA